MDNKGQGALEYLLLIAGAIMVAVIVITILSGMAQSGNELAQHELAEANAALNP